jgi:hypothetical protein
LITINHWFPVGLSDNGMRLDWVIKTLFELDDDPVLKNVNDILPEILQSYRLPAAIRWSLLFTTFVPVPGISNPSGCEPIKPLSFSVVISVLP